MKAKLTRLAVIAVATLGLAQATSAFAYDTVRCEDGVMEIDGTNGSYTFSGYCEKVIIAGGDNRVVLGDVGTLEIAGSNQDVTAGNIKVLDMAGGDNSAKLGDVSNAEIYGSDHNVWARVIGIMDVAGGNNGIKSERLGSVSVAGNDHLIEYRQLNPNTRNPKKPTHPGRQISGSSNVVRWNKAAF